MHFISFGVTLYTHIYDIFTNYICIGMIMWHIWVFKMLLILPHTLHTLLCKPFHCIHILKHVQQQILTSAIKKLKWEGHHENWSRIMIPECTHVRLFKMLKKEMSENVRILQDLEIIYCNSSGYTNAEKLFIIVNVHLFRWIIIMSYPERMDRLRYKYLTLLKYTMMNRTWMRTAPLSISWKKKL